jgi:hypothetical protein
MRSVCEICDEEIVSNITGEVWYHLPDDPLRSVLSQGRSEPILHRATPGEVEHTCRHPNPACPFCDRDEAARWLADRLAEADAGDRPMPGLS